MQEDKLFMILINKKAFLTKEYKEDDAGFHFSNYVEIEAKNHYSDEIRKALIRSFNSLIKIKKEYFTPRQFQEAMTYIHCL